MNDFIKKLHEFQTKFKSDVGVQPTEHKFKVVALLRVGLLIEELSEFQQAVSTVIHASNKDEEKEGLVEMVDGITDLLYVVIGTAVALNINIEEAFNEVHRSNMSKLDANGEPIFREDGKILKGENYSPPELERFVGKNERGECIFV